MEKTWEVVEFLYLLVNHHFFNRLLSLLTCWLPLLNKTSGFACCCGWALWRAARSAAIRLSWWTLWSKGSNYMIGDAYYSEASLCVGRKSILTLLINTSLESSRSETLSWFKLMSKSSPSTFRYLDETFLLGRAALELESSLCCSPCAGIGPEIGLFSFCISRWFCNMIGFWDSGFIFWSKFGYFWPNLINSLRPICQKLLSTHCSTFLLYWL